MKRRAVLFLNQKGETQLGVLSNKIGKGNCVKLLSEICEGHDIDFVCEKYGVPVATFRDKILKQVHSIGVRVE